MLLPTMGASFFKTLKTELQNDARFGSREEARVQLFEYIEVFYNRRRLHSTLGYLSPAQYELNCPSLVSIKAGHLPPSPIPQII